MAQITIGLKPEIRKRLDAILASQDSSFKTINFIIEQCILHYLPEIEQEMRDVENKRLRR